MPRTSILLRYGRALGAWLLLSALPASPSSAATVTIDPAVEHQTILGWGATCANIDLPAPLRDQILDAAVNELGLTRLRLEVPRREWEDAVNDNSDPLDTDDSAFHSTAADALVSNWVLPFRRRVEANGDPFCLYISPSFFEGGSTGGPPAWLLNSPGEYTEWATAFLQHLKRKHDLVPTFYSICNEAGNNNPFTPAVVGSIIKTLGPRLESLGFPTRIEFPECVNADTSWNYIQALRNDPEVWRYVGLLSYHLYGGNSQRKSIRDFARSRSLPTAQTEFMGTTVNHLYEDLTQGGVSYWEHYVMAFHGDTPNSGDYIGANFNQTSFTRYPEYWRFRQVMRYVRPGARRVEAASDDAALRCLAFTHDGQVTVVLLNTSGGAQSRSATVSGLPQGTYGVCQASGTAAYRELGAQKVAAEGTLAVSVAPNAVLTVYPRPEGNLPPVPTEWRASPSLLKVPASRVTLSATATDPDKDSLSYHWEVISQPPGAQASLGSPESASTSASGLSEPGEYAFSVTVRDAELSATREVRLRVLEGNQPPVVGAHNRQPVTVILPTAATTLRGEARDPDGDPLTVRWSVASQPEGASAALATPNQAACVASKLTVAGDYVFHFEARDAEHTVTRDLTVRVYPASQAPSLSSVEASASRVVLPVSRVTLQASVAPLPGEAVTLWWSVKSAPTGAHPVLQTPGAASTLATGLTAPGTYTFRLTAISLAKTATRDVTVTVDPPLRRWCRET